MNNKVDFASVLPISLIDGPTIVNKYGDVTFCFAYSGKEMFSLDKLGLVEQNAVLDGAYHFLDESFVIHKQDVCVEAIYQPGRPEYQSYLSEAFANHYNNKLYHRYQSYLFITKTEGLSLKRDYSVARVAGNTANARNNVAQIKDAIVAFAEHLKRNGITLRPLKEDEVYSLVEGYFSAYKDGLLADLMFGQDFMIGSQHVGIYALNTDENQPEYASPFALNQDYSTEDAKVFSDLMYALGYGWKANHILNQMIFLDGQSHWRTELEKKTQSLHSMKLFSMSNAKKADDNAAFLKATLNEDNKRVVRAHVNVVFWADDKAVFKSLGTDAKGRFIQLGMIPHQANYLDIKHIYLSSVPGNAGTMPFEETFVTHSDVASCYFTKESVIDRSMGKPSANGLMFTDRASNIPMYRDCWKKPYETKLIDNRNFLVIGKSGGGKSATTIEILRQYLELGFDITVIDIGRSFEVLAKLYDGNYIVYEAGMSLGINPFEAPDARLSVDKLEFLATFVFILWKPKETLEDEKRAALEKVLLAYYKAELTEKDYTIGIDGTGADIKAFYRFVESNQEAISALVKGREEFFDVDSFLLTLEQYVTGKFASLFTTGEGTRLVDPTKPLTCFELDNVKDHATLFPIFSMLITYMSTEVLWKRRDSYKIFLFDEAWKVLEKPGQATFVKYLFKTARKFDAAVGLNIQTIGDLNVPYGNLEETVLGNTDIKLIMKHKKDLIPSLIEKIFLSEHEQSLLLSIENNLVGKYAYTEHLNMVGKDVKVVRVMVSPEQRVNFMSEFKDKKLLFEMIEQEGSREQAIERFIAHKGWAA
jgi:conjugation system TraG family ATPase